VGTPDFSPPFAKIERGTGIYPHRETVMHPELPRSAKLSLSAYSDMSGQFGHKFENKFTSTTFWWIEGEKDYLVFKGSAEPRDFLVDIFAFPPVRYLRNWVHPGFALAHKSIKPRLLKILRKIKSENKQLVITGHSLGAAQAELTHLLALSYGIDSTAICFGKPRVFLKSSKSRFPKGSMLSVVSGSDIVARVPRYCYTVGCKDQDFLYLSNHDDVYLNPDMDFVADDFSVSDSISDHSMEAYLQRVGGL